MSGSHGVAQFVCYVGDPSQTGFPEAKFMSRSYHASTTYQPLALGREATGGLSGVVKARPQLTLRTPEVLSWWPTRNLAWGKGPVHGSPAYDVLETCGLIRARLGC